MSRTSDDIVERSEHLTPGPALGLAALLDLPVPDLEAGDGLPLLWHWVYLLERPATADLGPDGHPLRGAIPAPPEPGRRRMWAGGTVRTVGPLRIGRTATRRSRILRTVDKVGRSGPMTFVTVRHEISQDGHTRVEEDQEIVYRVAPDPDGGTSDPVDPADASDAADARDAADASDAAPGASSGWALKTPITLLFRFSALTYNGHRIHYDRDFARGEGYPGLVVHGPLQALLMAEHLRSRRPTDRSGSTFTYRLLAPAFDHDGLVVAQGPSDRGRITADVRTSAGRHTAIAELRW